MALQLHPTTLEVVFNCRFAHSNFVVTIATPGRGPFPIVRLLEGEDGAWQGQAPSLHSASGSRQPIPQGAKRFLLSAIGFLQPIHDRL